MKSTLLFTLLLCSVCFAQDTKKIATPAYWSAVAVTTGMATVDIVTSQQGYARTPNCHEVASTWLLGPRPSAARESLTFGAEVALTSYAAYAIKKHGGRFGKLWAVPFALSVVQHGRGAVSNVQTCR